MANRIEKIADTLLISFCFTVMFVLLPLSLLVAIISYIYAKLFDKASKDRYDD
jgi:MFS superfamily sulfate permease-like transporter